MNGINDGWNINVDFVTIAHENFLNGYGKCDYSAGRMISGLSLALEGNAEYEFNSGNKYSIKAGDMVFLPANTAYTIPFFDNYKHFTVNFNIASSTGNVLECNDMLILHTENKRHFESLFRELSNVWKEKKGGYEMRAVAYVYRLLIDFIEERNSLVLAKTPYYGALLPAKLYIEENYCKPISLAELSLLCHMSTTNFRRRFLEIFGVNPIEYRDNLRILHAKDYLSGGYHTVSETAFNCGFDDVSYFCRFFKKHMGITPKEYSLM